LIRKKKGKIAQDGLTIADVEQLLRTRLIVAKFINQSIGSELIVTESDINQYYEKNSEEFTAQEGQIRAAHILVSSEDNANEILEELEQGADFEELARQESIDTGSAQAGGDLGFFAQEQMVPEFGEAAFELDVGELSDVVESQFGFHIIKRLPDQIPLEDVRDQIEQALISGKQSAATETLVKQLRSRADIQVMQETFIKEDTEGKKETPSDISTFRKTSDPICMEDGKPIIRLYSTTTCPHCEWISDTFESTVEDYQGEIVAHHWELDLGDDTLTSVRETNIPTEEFEIFRKYSTGGVPTFVFGCRYVRIGNGYEARNDLDAEESEFRAVIEKLIA
jgi:thiol-disulfide isomerase/thioredoxin